MSKNNVVILEEYRATIKAREEAAYVRVMRDPVNHGHSFCTCSYDPRGDGIKKKDEDKR